MKLLTIKLTEQIEDQIITVEKSISEDTYERYAWSDQAEFYHSTMVELHDKLNAEKEKLNL